MFAVQNPSSATHIPCPDIIFDSVIWEKDVLLLSVDKTEHDLDQEYVKQVEDAGLQLEDDMTAQATDESSHTICPQNLDAQDSLLSLQSSLSAGATDCSRASRDTQGDRSLLSVPIATPRSSEPSLRPSIRTSHDSVVNSIRPQLRATRSQSSASTRSMFSLGPDRRNRPQSISRKKRNPLSFFRREHSTCYSRTCHGYRTSAITSIPTRLNDLECGHSLDDFSVRMHVKEAFENGRVVSPSCCSISIPEKVLASILSPIELESMERKLATRYNIREHTTSSVDHAVIPAAQPSLKPLQINLALASPTLLSPLRLDINSAAQSNVSLAVAGPKLVSGRPIEPTTDELRLLELALEDPHFARLRLEQEQEYSRTTAFEFRQRRMIAVHYDRQREDYWALHRREREDLAEQHAHAIEELEEMQISREIELQQTHREERQNVGTALKYMEAYCGLTTTSTLLPSKSALRPVSEQDYRKLEQQYVLRDTLDQKHEAAITVLRARQDRALKTRAQRQHNELLQLDKDFEMSLTALDDAREKDETRQETLAEERRRRAEKRWRLKYALWKQDSEKSREEPWPASFPSLDWPDPIASSAQLKTTAGSSLEFFAR